MRLIDAEALKKELELSKYIILTSKNRLLNSEINRCIKAIDNASTVCEMFGEIPEFHEPKKGEWIDICTLPAMVKCSHCGTVLGMAENISLNFNFCPNCGADMRGD